MSNQPNVESIVKRNKRKLQTIIWQLIFSDTSSPIDCTVKNDEQSN